LQMFIDPSNLALNLGLFFVTSLRFMPSIARLQSYINQVDRGSQGSEMFLEIFEKNEVVQSSKFSNFLKIESSNLISAKNINVSIEGRDLFSFEELLLPPKGLVVIHGESGCGKSTLLSLLAGIDELNEDSEGKIINFANETIYISQFTSLLPFTIKENILLDLESTAENIERYQTLIELLNLQNTLENDNSQRTMRTGFTLSGGELQRIGIARGLMRKSRFYFLDELSASLDAVNRNAVWKLLKNESRKALIVVATHDIEGLSFADLVYRIQNKALILDSNG